MQLLAPGHSLSDASTIVDRMDQGQLFANVRCSAARASILARILDVRGRILSLYTFQEDTKYLEPCAKIMKKLLPKVKISMEHEYSTNFAPENGGEGAWIFRRGDEWTNIRAGPRKASRLAYLQLWLFAMRNFPLMHKLNPRKDHGDPEILYNIRNQLMPTFAMFASRLGFSSSQISDRKDQDTGGGEAEALVHYIWPLNQHVCDAFPESDDLQCDPEPPNRILVIPDRCEIPSLVTDQSDERLQNRCGRPFNRSYVKDRPFLYLQDIYTCDARSEGTYFTSFGVKRDIFIAFFGDTTIDDEHIENHPNLGNLSSHEDFLVAGETSNRNMPSSPEPQSPNFQQIESPILAISTTVSSIPPIPTPASPATSPSGPLRPPDNSVACTHVGEAHIRDSPIENITGDHNDHQSGITSEGQEDETTETTETIETTVLTQNILTPHSISLDAFLEGFDLVGGVLFYDLHSRALYPASGANAVVACETIACNMLQRGCGFMSPVWEGFKFLQLHELRQCSQYRLRFVFKKGVTSVAQGAKADVIRLIEAFYSIDAHQILESDWFFRTDGE